MWRSVNNTAIRCPINPCVNNCLATAPISDNRCVIGGCVRDDGCGIPELVRVIRLVFSVNRQDRSIRILV